MHSVFLFHAIPAGLDMAIVNAGQLDVYDTIDPELRDACEDVILDRRDDATERLVALAGKYRGTAAAQEKAAAAWRGWAVERSEEPTSELQSLMRISYASVGLENKKHRSRSVR